MRRIPDVLINTKSGAEARIFELLGSVELGDQWFALHSLNCSEHGYKHWAEIDFLLAGPEAVLVIEVKGGRVQCTDGIWTYFDRFGRSRTTAEGPFGQARSAMYAIQKLLSERYRLDSIVSGRACFGFGVLFPDVDWDLDSPEAPAALAADRAMLRTGAGMTRFIRSLVHYWRGKFPNAYNLAAPDLRELRNRLRPDVDVYPPVSQRLGLALREMQHLTEEQYERLDVLEQNDRAIVSGGAGTGKTFLLMQLARREASRGRKVMIVVYSEVLAAHIRRALPEPQIHVHTLGSLHSDAIPADILLVDEGQDLMTFDALSLISPFIAGGLDEGRWCWFLDENNQAGVAGSFDPEALEHLATGLTTGKPVRLPLRRNCRNTKEIVRQVQLWTGGDIGVTHVTGYGAAPQVVVIKEREKSNVIIEQLLSNLLDGGTAPEDIGIVTPGSSPPELFRNLSSPIKRLLTPLTVATVAADLRGRILWGSPAAYKGLERPNMFVLAFEPDVLPSDAELYVAATRANVGLWILASPRVAAQLAEAHRYRISRQS
jgi:hypothetical protein